MSQLNKEIALYGIPGSPGVSHGPVFRFLHGDVEVPQYQVSVSEQESELERFKDSVAITRTQIEGIRNEVAKNLGEKEAGIFDAHILVLEDKALFVDIEKEIKKTGDNIEQCVYRVTQRYHDYFNQLEDEYLRERAADLKDISKRLLRNLIGETAAGTAFLGEPRILVSEDLSPSDTASLDRSKILGIATDTGGRTSHAVIMARASGVPAVVGVRGLTEKLGEGDTILIDGFEPVKNKISGDDMYLVQAISKVKSGSINIDPNSFVSTKPMKNIKEFINQRIRWSSNAKLNVKKNPYFFSFLVSSFSFNLILLFYFLFSETWILLFLFKFLCDGLVVFIGSKLFDVNIKFPAYLLWAITQPFYIPAIGLLGIREKFTWKK